MFLAAAGGAPGVAGEVAIFNAATGKQVRTLQEHFDVVYAVAWKPGGAAELATGSLDKTVRIWDAASGKCRRVLKDHADAVFGVAYSPDGKLLATGSADRSVKLTDTTTWKRVASLSAHQDAVTRVAFNHDGTLLATAGADKTVRMWKIEPNNKMENPLRTLNEGDTINACAFSPDGSLFVYGASNRTVKVFSSDGAQQKQSFGDVPDWVYSAAIAGDNRTIAAGTQDGKVFFWDAKEGKLLRTVSLSPAPGEKVVARSNGGAK
jgi:WD40 repeat protein